MKGQTLVAMAIASMFAASIAFAAPVTTNPANANTVAQPKTQLTDMNDIPPVVSGSTAVSGNSSVSGSNGMSGTMSGTNTMSGSATPPSSDSDTNADTTTGDEDY